MTDVVAPIITGLLGISGTVGVTVLKHYLDNRTPKGDFAQSYKLFYIKAFHLSDAAAAKSPIYLKRVERLNENVPVYDEFHCFALNVFRKEQKQFKWEIVSKGIPDCRTLYPWEELETLDEITASSRHTMSGDIKKQSQVYCVKSVRYNGFQPGNTTQGMEMEVNTREARLVVDVSSIQNFSRIFSEKPKGLLVRSEKKDKPLEVNGELSNGIFEIFATDLQKGEIIKMNFAISWDAITTA